MTATTDDLESLVAELLVRDPDRHAEALDAIAEISDPRAIPHLIEVLMIHEIGDNWEQFGFPEVLREHSPPRYLELPKAHWPGIREALRTIAGPDYDSAYAWVEWETWYSQRDVEPLEGFDEWKLQLYRSYLPPVGRLLNAEPRAFDLQDVRRGNCDPSFLAACNEPHFVPGDAVSVDSGDGDGLTDDGKDDARTDGEAAEQYLGPTTPSSVSPSTTPPTPCRGGYCSPTNWRTSPSRGRPSADRLYAL